MVIVVVIVRLLVSSLTQVTGVFCNTAIASWSSSRSGHGVATQESAHADRDIAIMKQMIKQKAQALQDD